jgi:hypothetical protein
VQTSKQLFIGIKVSSALRTELDRPAPGTEQYLEPGIPDYLEFVMKGDVKIVGRHMEDGCTADEIEILVHKLCRIIRNVTRGHRVEEESVLIYAG